MMSDARKNPVPGSPEGISVQIHSHQEEHKAQLFDKLTDFLLESSEDDFDSEQLDTILASLEEIDPMPDFADDEASLAAFHEKFAPVFESVAANSTAATIKPSPSKKRSRSILRKFIPVAAVIAILLCGSLSAYAFGFEGLMDALIHWTSDIFCTDRNNTSYAEITLNPLEEGEEASFDSLQEALDAFGVEAKMVPQWIPERFILEEAKAKNELSGSIISVVYLSDAEYLQITYRESTTDTTAFETNNADIDMRMVSGIEHYIMPDLDRYKAYWQNGVFTCSITGTVSEEEMFQIVDSIYEQEEK